MLRNKLLLCFGLVLLGATGSHAAKDAAVAISHDASTFNAMMFANTEGACVTKRAEDDKYCWDANCDKNCAGDVCLAVTEKGKNPCVDADCDGHCDAKPSKEEGKPCINKREKGGKCFDETCNGCDEGEVCIAATKAGGHPCVDADCDGTCDDEQKKDEKKDAAIIPKEGKANTWCVDVDGDKVCDPEEECIAKGTDGAFCIDADCNGECDATVNHGDHKANCVAEQKPVGKGLFCLDKDCDHECEGVGQGEICIVAKKGSAAPCIDADCNGECDGASSKSAAKLCLHKKAEHVFCIDADCDKQCEEGEACITRRHHGSHDPCPDADCNGVCDDDGKKHHCMAEGKRQVDGKEVVVHCLDDDCNVKCDDNEHCVAIGNGKPCIDADCDGKCDEKVHHAHHTLIEANGRFCFDDDHDKNCAAPGDVCVVAHDGKPCIDANCDGQCDATHSETLAAGVHAGFVQKSTSEIRVHSKAERANVNLKASLDTETETGISLTGPEEEAAKKKAEEEKAAAEKKKKEEADAAANKDGKKDGEEGKGDKKTTEEGDKSEKKKPESGATTTTPAFTALAVLAVTAFVCA